MPLETAGKPFVFQSDATFELAGVVMNCVTNKISLKPSTTMVPAVTICASVDYPGASKWTLQAVLYQSFEDNTATYGVLSAAKLAGVPVPYKVRFHPGAAGPANPEFAGELIPQPFNIVDSTVGALVEVDFTWSCTGEPTEDVGTGPAPIGTGYATALRAAASAGNGRKREPEPA